MRQIRRLLVLATALAVVLPGSAAVAAPAKDPQYRVSTKGWIGAYRQTDLADLLAQYGAPTSTKPDASGSSCTLRWAPLGMTVQTSTFGDTAADPCTDGTFLGASLTGAQWFTNRGLFVGASAAAARQQAKRKCRQFECWNPATNAATRSGYVLSTHANDCAGARTPTVVALTKGAKVSGLAVLWLGCE